MLYSPTRNNKKGMHLFSPRRTASAVLPAATSAVSATASVAISKLGMGTDDAQKPEDSERPKGEQENPENDERMDQTVESKQNGSEDTVTEETERAEDSTASNELQETKVDDEVSDQGTEIFLADGKGKENDSNKEKIDHDQSEWASNLFYAYARRVSLLYSQVILLTIFAY
jgi:hypothetical protein